MFPVDPPLTPGAKPGRYPADAERADFKGYAAFMRSRQTDVDLARYARSMLARDPENIWAMLVLADVAGSEFERTVILREAVRVGKHFWAGWKPDKFLPTHVRPWHKTEGGGDYLRAACRYAVELQRLGIGQAASECLDELLEIDAADSMGFAESLTSEGVTRLSDPLAGPGIT